jgi:hypothetical protein
LYDETVTNVSLENGIIDKKMQETVNVKKRIEIENLFFSAFYLSLSFISLFTILLFSFLFKRAQIHFMVRHPRRANARSNIIHCWQK